MCKIDAWPQDLGRPETLLADNGYFSEANVTLCEADKIEPLIALGRQPNEHPDHDTIATFRRRLYGLAPVSWRGEVLESWYLA